MYATPRTSTVYVAVAAAVVALVLLTSTTLTASVYATRHHSHRSIQDMPTNFAGYQAYGNNPVSDQGYGPQLASQGYGPQLASQGYGNGNPVTDEAYGNGNPVTDEAYGNGNNPGSNEINGPVSTYAGSQSQNSDINSLNSGINSIIKHVIATMDW